MEQYFKRIAQQHDFKILELRPLSGGDINMVYHIKSVETSYVVKLNHASIFPGMFEAEAKGLRLLASSNTFKIPEVVGFDQVNDRSYLLMEYLDPGNLHKFDWTCFTENLAKLHQHSNHVFGLDHDNYIGSLPQYNSAETSASNFYINQRLNPQFKMAMEKGYKFSNLDNLFKNIFTEIPTEPPSLIHGDLWNGNYLVTASGEAALIDPALSYGPREMDIAMMRLFGGFPDRFYSHYHELFPLVEGWKERILIWQLYYLLVHLNLFGAGYLPQVNSIIKSFS
jgi:fructosamine-3-kinase